MLLALAIACTGRPAWIPAEPGEFTTETVPEFAFAASADLPWLVYSTVRQAQVEDFRSCPVVTEEGFSSTAGCSDSAGVAWKGSASVEVQYDTENIRVQNLRVEGVDAGWEATGTLTSTVFMSSVGGRLSSNLQFTSLTVPEKRFWIDTTTAYVYYEADSLVVVDEHRGTVGIEGWGTAQIDGRRILQSQLYGCDFGAHTFGSLVAIGANEVVLDYTSLGSVRLPADVDADTGDTGADTGADTGDTGADTGDTGDTGIEFPDTSRGCGGCTMVTIDQLLQPQCLELTRDATYPFFSL